MRNFTAMKTNRMIILMFGFVLLSACDSGIPIQVETIKISQLQHHWKLALIDKIKLATVINSTLKIDQNNNLSGNLGCNNFRGKAYLNENQLNIKEMAKTLKKCSEIEKSVEEDVSSVLRRSATVMIENKTLTISNSQHSLTYDFVK